MIGGAAVAGIGYYVYSQGSSQAAVSDTESKSAFLYLVFIPGCSCLCREILWAPRVVPILGHVFNGTTFSS